MEAFYNFCEKYPAVKNKADHFHSEDKERMMSSKQL